MSVKTTYKAPPQTLSYAWVILVAVYLASVAAPLNQAKAPPILPVLMGAFQLNLGQAGMLISVFAITGILLALPAGLILQRLGSKTTGLVALSCLASGSVLGALSTQVGVLLFSRVIEGVGMGLIGVVAPAAIAAWFPPEKQGAPMGIWATWVPVGTITMYLLAPRLATGMGWQIVWWSAAVFTLAAMLVYGLLVREPAAASTEPGAKGAGREIIDLRKALANRNIWLLGLCFVFFNLVFISVGTYYPTFLSEVRGYSLADAASIASVSTLLVLFSAPFAGWLSDRLNSRRLVFTLPMVGVAILMLLPFRVTGWQIYALMASIGLLAGAVPTAIFSAAPEVMKDARLAGVGLSVIMLGQNLGIFIGPMLFGALVKSQGWAAAGVWLVPLCLAGFLAGWFVKIR